MMVAPLSATVRHQRRGWNRSSGTTAPPRMIMPSVEQASAFM